MARPATPSARRRALAAGLLLGLGCGAPPSSLLDGSIDAVVVDAAPPDADVIAMGPALGLDSIALTGGNLIFGQLGSQLLNPQLAQMIESGQFLLVLELRDLDDPSGKTDPDLALGIYSATDSDDDPSDNFDAGRPEQLIASPLSVGEGGAPLVLWNDAAIASRVLTASGQLEISLPGGIALPFDDAAIEGTLHAAPGGVAIDYLADATLTGTVPVALLGAIPNLLTGTCPGSTLLDVLIGGCGYGFSAQPDVDVDGDGLETLFVGDTGVVERCVDGDDTEILGADCFRDPRIADGYRMVFSIHGTRVALVREP